MVQGVEAGVFNLQFRLLIDDVNSSRFTDEQVNAFYNMAETDVQNDLRDHGWDLRLSNNEDVTIPSGSQEAIVSATALGYGVPLWVRRNETNDKSVIPVLTERDAVKSLYPAVYIKGSASNFSLGYYVEAESDLKFTVFFTNDATGKFSFTTYDENDVGINIPATYTNLIIYRACALASSTDKNKVSIWDGRYQQVLRAAIGFAGILSDQVTDVYDDYGNC